MEYGQPVELEKIDVTRGIRRYYRLWLRPDLFAEVCLIRQWGRIGQAGGHARVEPFEDVGTARAKLERLVAAKRRRGYQATGICQITEAVTGIDEA